MKETMPVVNKTRTGRPIAGLKEITGPNAIPESSKDYGQPKIIGPKGIVTTMPPKVPKK